MLFVALGNKIFCMCQECIELLFYGNRVNIAQLMFMVNGVVESPQ